MSDSDGEDAEGAGETPVGDGGATPDADAGADRATDESPVHGGEDHAYIERVGRLTDTFINGVEIIAAAVFAVLFAIGVVDLILQIVEAVRNGSITDPLVVISFIDTGLLLLIIVEVYQTVIAYTRESDTSVIVRLVIYTGVIAMVRKVIVFRTSEYSSEANALLVAASYTVIIAGLVGLLVVERQFGGILNIGSGTGTRDTEN
jgi:uncharacterized membrane protein (DUF373 family)